MPEPGVRDFEGGNNGRAFDDKPGTDRERSNDNDSTNRNNPSSRKGFGFQLPAGFENILLADGRTLGDLFGSLGRGRFLDRQSGELWARLKERRAQANRLGFNKSLLTRLDGDAKPAPP